MTKINISIPQPCHENWEAMTSVNKGKFCSSCQKKVFDFTNASDREIVNAFQQNENLCGRFLNTQLNRDLVKPKEKSLIWLATTTALISLVTVNEATAQQPVKTEQRENDISGKVTPLKTDSDTILVSGIVYDENKTPVPNLGIYDRDYKIGETNSNGNFSVRTHLKARIVFRNADEDSYEANDYFVESDYNNNIEINYVKHIFVMKSYTVGGAIAIQNKPKKCNFFGRIFHAIGNWFR